MVGDGRVLVVGLGLLLTEACEGGMVMGGAGGLQAGGTGGPGRTGAGGGGGETYCASVGDPSGRHIVNCQPGEICFTNISCPVAMPPNMPVSLCFEAGSRPLANKCRRKCSTDTDCLGNEKCESHRFAALGDAIGIHRICCTPGGCGRP